MVNKLNKDNPKKQTVLWNVKQRASINSVHSFRNRNDHLSLFRSHFKVRRRKQIDEIAWFGCLNSYYFGSTVFKLPVKIVPNISSSSEQWSYGTSSTEYSALWDLSYFFRSRGRTSGIPGVRITEFITSILKSLVIPAI